MSEPTTATAMPQSGEPAPDFTLPDGEGNSVSLAALRGQTVVLYFYPKDDTPGCTAEACGFRDAWEDLRARGVVVLGISRDTVKS
ncbi:MAG TPA: peroxiredoxin, partial [Ktedonobacterales bacterium]